MRLLLDENLPHGLKSDLGIEVEIRTVQEMGWAGMKDREILTRASDSGFIFLITIDKNLRYQQNMERFTIRLIVLMAQDNRRETLRQLALKASEVVKDNRSDKVIEIY